MAPAPESEHAWLYDYIVSFLRSPMWTTPIHSFIDQHCIQFDIPTATSSSASPSSTSHNENKLHYTELHTQFTQLVESLLESSLERIGVTNEQFAEVLMQEQASKMQNIVFDTILAVDDFQRFKRVMQKRNKQLEDEAMQLCESQEAALAALQSPTNQTRSFEKQIRKETATPPRASAPSATSPTQRQLQQQEHAALQHALRLSQAEHQKVVSKQQQIQMLEDKELNDAIRLSLQSASLQDRAQQPQPQRQSVPAEVWEAARANIASATSPTKPATESTAAPSVDKRPAEHEQKYHVEPDSVEQPPPSQQPEVATAAASTTTAHIAESSSAPAHAAQQAHTTEATPTVQPSIAAAAVLTDAATDVPASAVHTAESSSTTTSSSTAAPTQLSPTKPSTRPQLPPLQAPKTAAAQMATHHHQPLSPTTTQLQQHEAKEYHFPERFNTKPIELPATESSTAAPAASTSSSNVAVDELQRRKQYLLQQKQKLIAMKEAERQAALSSFNKQQQDDAAAASRSSTSPTATKPSTDTVKSVLKSRLEQMMGSSKGIAG